MTKCGYCDRDDLKGKKGQDMHLALGHIMKKKRLVREVLRRLQAQEPASPASPSESSDSVYSGILPGNAISGVDSMNIESNVSDGSESSSRTKFEPALVQVKVCGQYVCALILPQDPEQYSLENFIRDIKRARPTIEIPRHFYLKAKFKSGEGEVQSSTKFPSKHWAHVMKFVKNADFSQLHDGRGFVLKIKEKR